MRDGWGYDFVGFLDYDLALKSGVPGVLQLLIIRAVHEGFVGAALQGLSHDVEAALKSFVAAAETAVLWQRVTRFAPGQMRNDQILAARFCYNFNKTAAFPP